MTKRMIDVDALLSEFKNIIKRGTYNIMGVDYNINMPVFINILHKIEDLAIPSPEPQESIFDAEGWCRDLKAIPKNTLIDLAVQCVKDKSINREVNYILNDNNSFYSSDYEHCVDDTYEFGFVIIAWRPMPCLPKEA